MSYKLIAAAVLVGVMSVNLPVLAAAPYLGVPPQGNAGAGSKIAHGTCSACHGPDGNSIGGIFPNLAGQNYNYLLKQLEEFRSGIRNQQPMATIITTVPAAKDDKNLRDLATYYSEQTLKRKPAGSKVISKSEIEKGYRLFAAGSRRQHLPACAACHMPDGGGMAPMAVPYLAGQHSAYILAQLQAFSSGKRDNSFQHVMGIIAHRMSNADMQAVADYVSLMEPDLIVGTGPKSFAAYVKSQVGAVVPGIPKADVSATSPKSHGTP